MATITILPAFVKSKNLFAVPRDAYEQFLIWQRGVKSSKTFTPNKSEKTALSKARKNFSKGKYLTLEKLKYELGVTRR